MLIGLEGINTGRLARSQVNAPLLTVAKPQTDKEKRRQSFVESESEIDFKSTAFTTTTTTTKKTQKQKR